MFAQVLLIVPTLIGWGLHLNDRDPAMQNNCQQEKNHKK